MVDLKDNIIKTPGLVAFWDFQEPEGADRVSKGEYLYSLREASGKIAIAEDGVFGKYSADLKEGDYFFIPRKECGELDIHGKNANLTVIAWVKRGKKSCSQCESIAGMWNEENMKRQYCLFLNLGIHDSSEQVCGHVSSIGGPTPGQMWCMDASIGSSTVPLGQWQCIAFSYDGKHARSYLNGKLDQREIFNPYLYEEGIHDGGKNGSDFTVGAVYRLGEMGNWFVGLLGGLSVFNRALTEEEMNRLCKI